MLALASTFGASTRVTDVAITLKDIVMLDGVKCGVFDLLYTVAAGNQNIAMRGTITIRADNSQLAAVEASGKTHATVSSYSRKRTHF